MFLCKREMAALALAGCALPLGAIASNTEVAYPQRQVTVVIGYPPGGGADTLARLFARYMEEELKQKVVIEYRPGAAGNIGARTVARTAPDGYTVYLAGRSNTIHKSMYANLDYDFSRDLVPVGLLATTPFVIVTNARLPIASVHDVVSLAKAHPGVLSCASVGIGAADHLLCEMLQQETGIDLMHVPYSGSAAALADVMSGRVDIHIAPLPAALPHINAGRLRAIAAMSRRRVPALPEIPTIGEYGLPGIEGDAWYGLVAPAGTPPDVVARLNRSINAVLANPKLQESLAQLVYMTPLAPNTPETLSRLIAEETERWTNVVRNRNIKPLP